MRTCTCTGTCKGKAGLAPGWRCALEPFPPAPGSGPTAFKVGDEVHLEIPAVHGPRTYSGCGEILEIHGGYIAKVEYRQPWAPRHNCMRTTLLDLRTAKKLVRRKPKATNS